MSNNKDVLKNPTLINQSMKDNEYNKYQMCKKFNIQNAQDRDYSLQLVIN